MGRVCACRKFPREPRFGRYEKRPFCAFLESSKYAILPISIGRPVDFDSLSIHSRIGGQPITGQRGGVAASGHRATSARADFRPAVSLEITRMLSSARASSHFKIPAKSVCTIPARNAGDFVCARGQVFYVHEEPRHCEEYGGVNFGAKPTERRARGKVA